MIQSILNINQFLLKAKNSKLIEKPNYKLGEITKNQ